MQKDCVMKIDELKTFRSLLNWQWYDDINVRILFFHLLLTAYTEDKKWRGILVKKGSVIVGRSQLSKDCGLSEQQIRTAINKLQSTREITSNKTPLGTLFTINMLIDEKKSTSKTTEDQPQNNQGSTSNQPEKQSQKPKTKNKDNDYEEIKRLFNAMPTEFTEVKSLSSKRKSHIAARIKDHGIEKLGEVFRLASESNFLNGDNPSGWKANFDWILNPNNFIKILEGNYVNKQKKYTGKNADYEQRKNLTNTELAKRAAQSQVGKDFRYS